jgi:hypothetical protein
MRSKAEQLALLLDDVHIPLDDPQAPRDWKEWYHFILFDLATGTRVLANVSLSGIPGHGQIIVTVFATLPDQTGGPQEHTYGFCSDSEWVPGMVERAPPRLEGSDFRVLLEGLRSTFVARSPVQQVSIDMRGIATAMPLFIPELSPYGSGFLGWGLMPVVEAEGVLQVGSHSIEIGADWFCYHDHNYGRFRWGEDIGWIWFVASLRAGDQDMTVVLHRGNNRDQTRRGLPHLFVHQKNVLTKMFVGGAVRLEWRWDEQARQPPRMPPAMASLFADRSLMLPTALHVHARDEVDELEIELAVSSSTELVLADDMKRQYTFIEELTGASELRARIGAVSFFGPGYFYAEFVH